MKFICFYKNKMLNLEEYNCQSRKILGNNVQSRNLEGGKKVEKV